MPEIHSNPKNSPASGDQEIQSIKRQLREALPRLREEFAVKRLYLHGSRARGEAGPESDLDVLVDFEDSEAGRQVSLLDFIALNQELERLLGMEVDLGERKALRGPAGKAIEQEAESV
jgi:predicted nucleotidyltransferase